MAKYRIVKRTSREDPKVIEYQIYERDWPFGWEHKSTHRSLIEANKRIDLLINGFWIEEVVTKERI